MEKVCSGCRESLELSGFYPHASTKHGVSAYCRACAAQKAKAHYHASQKNDPAYKSRVRAYASKWHRKYRTRNNARVARNHRLEREACFAHYGTACACCGEHRYEFLSFDHINGGGRQHIKQIGSKLSRWLVRRGFPEGFRTLCHNCNQALGHYGYCPHKIEVTKRA